MPETANKNVNSRYPDTAEELEEKIGMSKGLLVYDKYISWCVVVLILLAS